MCFCLFAYICYLTETTMCQKPRSGNWAIFIIKKKKKKVAFKAALSLKQKGVFPTQQGKQIAHLGQSCGASEMVSGLIFLPLTQHYAQLICPCREVGRDLKDCLILS